ncbi:hypothetical protein THMIRHAS_16280 [Thiosulfatimonas sediminis]|uniref:HTH cro/C1-type domain-containing protein n=1 Tax=Thiosulfatimonas sediminis TaxID=2675054 RepID=A0A6F8PVV7_9GAMM|nr:helix-turn-helix transcriptional regulator [Thiosulfatimonas sediminis]BBP46255.1 hypothetical protein THMIRHAS_16280 [Thiosulfatimonas sediminis]
MPLAKRMRRYMQIKNLSAQEVAEKCGIPLSELQNFLDGIGAIDSMHFETLNSIWPELVAYTFNVDASVCTDFPITKH